VVPYRDGRLPDNSSVERVSDVERGDSKADVAVSEKDVEQGSWEPVLPDATPFFHIDLTSAVRAAENGLDRVSKLKEAKTVQSAY
jgi:sodium-independent sulfate anion transporter 11